MVSDILVNIGSDNGSSSAHCQAITWTNVAIKPIEPLVQTFSTILTEENAFENVIYKMLAISSRSQCVNQSPACQLQD